MNDADKKDTLEAKQKAHDEDSQPLQERPLSEPLSERVLSRPLQEQLEMTLKK